MVMYAHSSYGMVKTGEKLKLCQINCRLGAIKIKPYDWLSVVSKLRVFIKRCVKRCVSTNFPRANISQG